MTLYKRCKKSFACVACPIKLKFGPHVVYIYTNVEKNSWTKGIQFEGLFLQLGKVAIVGKVVSIHCTFFDNIIFVIQLVQFIRQTPMSGALQKAHVIIWDHAARVSLSSPTSDFRVGILCSDPDWQVSYLEQVCTFILPYIFTLEDLYIYEARSSWQDIGDTLWLELLRPFTTVRSLFISKKIAPCIVAALKELLGGTTDVLPTLQNIFLEKLRRSGPVRDNVGQFVAARQVIGHQIAVSRWDTSEKDKIWW
jgi:hypothetical protein